MAVRYAAQPIRAPSRSLFQNCEPLSSISRADRCHARQLITRQRRNPAGAPCALGVLFRAIHIALQVEDGRERDVRFEVVRIFDNALARSNF